MSRYRYNSKKGGFFHKIPVWVFCVAALSIYFGLWENKVIEFATDAPLNSAGREDDHDIGMTVKSRI